jgi:tetratricopeptide (TPR) repeat protein
MPWRGLAWRTRTTSPRDTEEQRRRKLIPKRETPRRRPCNGMIRWPKRTPRWPRQKHQLEIMNQQNANSSAPLRSTPGYAHAHYFYGFVYFLPMGRLDEAISELKKALELDPTALIINVNLARIYFIARQYDLAEEQFRRTAELDPNFVPLLARRMDMYEQKGNYEKAMEILRRIPKGSPQDPYLSPERFEAMRHAFAKEGAKGFWRMKLEFYKQDVKERYIAPANIAVAYAHVGDMESAFKWLEKAVSEKDEETTWMNASPSFDLFRSDPGWKELVRRVGVTPVDIRNN